MLKLVTSVCNSFQYVWGFGQPSSFALINLIPTFRVPTEAVSESASEKPH